MRRAAEGEYLDVHFPPWDHNSTSAEFALILMVRPMKYLSGGTTHSGALILKTMETKFPPPSPASVRP